MKKLLFVFLALFITSPVLAYDYSQMCPIPPYPVSNKFAQIISTATGTNFLLTQVAESVMEKSLKKELDSNFQVNIKPYGAKNFIDGKFRELTVSSPKIVYSGTSVSDFHASTMCNYNHVVLKKHDIAFAENFVLRYSTLITNKDLQYTTASKEYSSLLNKLTVSVGNKILFKVFDPNAVIENNRIKFSFKVITPLFFVDEVSTVNLSTSLSVKNEKLVFSDISTGDKSDAYNHALGKMLTVINKLNPLTYNVPVSKSAEGILKVQNVKITNSKIYVDGVFIIPKNYAM